MLAVLAVLSGWVVQVLRLGARGVTKGDIGRELFIAGATVQARLLRAFDKFGVGVGRRLGARRGREV